MNILNVDSYHDITSIYLNGCIATCASLIDVAICCTNTVVFSVTFSVNTFTVVIVFLATEGMVSSIISIVGHMAGSSSGHVTANRHCQLFSCTASLGVSGTNGYVGFVGDVGFVGVVGFVGFHEDHPPQA
jgi:hypothetical protein